MKKKDTNKIAGLVLKACRSKAIELFPENSMRKAYVLGCIGATARMVKHLKTQKKKSRKEGK